MTNCKPIYEFIVWENCNNNCQFCFQRENPKIFNKNERELILGKVLDFVDSDKFIKGSHLLIVGGEIFHLINDKDTIEAFYDVVINHMKSNVIDLLYINTNLIYQNLEVLTTVLDNLKEEKLLERVRFTTSYDIDGRFKDYDDFVTFSKNVKFIRNQYPEMSFVVNTILTKRVCELLTTAEYKWSVKKQMEDWDCWINLIPYIIYDKKLSATREEIFNALEAVEEENTGYLKRYIQNLDLKQDKLVYINNNGNLELCKSDDNTCGHSVNFTRYSENSSCYICDLKRCFDGYIQE